MSKIKIHKENIFFKNVSFIRNDFAILDKINFQVLENENLLILGKNGSGKSTLLNLIFGFFWATSGYIKIFEKTYGEFPILEVQKKIGTLLPNLWEDRINRNITIEEVLLTGFDNKLGIYSEYKKENYLELEKIYSENSWIKDKNRTYSKCSSGERKKILLLRALLLKPEILILDEPCSSLDISSKLEFFEILEKQTLSSIILITHNLDEIKPYFHKTLFLKEGKILDFGETKKVLNSQNLSNAYDKNLILQELNGVYFYSKI